MTHDDKPETGFGFPPLPMLRSQPPSQRFTWGLRAGIVLAAVLYGGLAVWTRATTEHAMSTPQAVLFVLNAVVAVVALAEAWCWAGRPRFDASRSEAITAGLCPETKKAVQRMARGRGPDVAELRPRAAASASAQRQNTSLVISLLTLNNLAILAQSSGSVVGLVLGTVGLLSAGVVLANTLWLGHRARTLNAALHLDTGSPAVTP